MADDFQKITSLQNPHIKAAAKLRTRKVRRQEDQIIIDGWREIQRACNADVRIVKLFATSTWLSSTSSDQLNVIRQSRPACFELSNAAFEKIAFGQRNEGIVAVAETPTTTVSDLQLPKVPLIAVVEGIEKPGNLGAIVRTADGAGFDAVIVTEMVTDIYNPNAIRASIGTIFCIPVVQQSSHATLTWLLENKIRIFAARVDARQCYAEADFTQPTAIVLGSEAEGLSPTWTGNRVTPIRLPMMGVADSLNVSAAAAIFYYEARKQRGSPDRNDV